jgi:hypothetical protein
MSLCDRPIRNGVGFVTHGLGVPVSLCFKPVRQSQGDTNVRRGRLLE